MHIGNYLELIQKSEEDLAKAFHLVVNEHRDEPDIYEMCELLASWSGQIMMELTPIVKRYAKEKTKNPTD